MRPELDKRTKDIVLDEIYKLARSYTPEWRFQPEKPDMGTTLALLYAEVMSHVIGEYNQVPERNRVAFFQALGAEVLEAERAEGYMTFRLSRPDMPENVVPRGTGVAADGKAAGLIRYETLQDVFVAAAEVCLAEADDENCYLRFDRKPERGLLSILLVQKGGGKQGRSSTRWEYYGEEGWMPIEVEDATGGFVHTGLLRFAGTPEFCGTMVGDVGGFWIRGRREDGARLSRTTMEVYGNAVKVRAKQPGITGNRMPDRNHRLVQSIGYVTRIQNPDILYGGRPAETAEEAMERNSARIRHRFRAVTPGDFESLVYESAPDVRKVKCFPGYDGDGKPCPGGVTVVVLQKDFMEGRHYFYRVREQIYGSLKQWADGLMVWEGRLWVARPVFVRMHVRAELFVKSHDQVMEAERTTRELLETYLNPVVGGHDKRGWDIGRIPEYGQVKRLLQKQEDVCGVKRLWISYEQDEDGNFAETEEEKVRRMPWILPVSGSHQIVAGVIPGKRQGGV